MLKKSVLLLACSLAFFSAVFSQKIIDSVKVYEFPVKEGVIYQYEAKSVYGSFNAMPIITVSTKYDTVYHFEEGTITDVRKIDDFWAVCLENKKQEIVVYSNLKSAAVKAGDKVMRGGYIGVLDKDYANELNQVDVLIFQKGKEIPYKKIMDYMRRIISSSPPKSYTL
jgi:hypothetical protein